MKIKKGPCGDKKGTVLFKRKNGTISLTRREDALNA